MHAASGGSSRPAARSKVPAGRAVEPRAGQGRSLRPLPGTAGWGGGRVEAPAPPFLRPSPTPALHAAAPASAKMAPGIVVRLRRSTARPRLVSRGQARPRSLALPTIAPASSPSQPFPASHHGGTEERLARSPPRTPSLGRGLSRKRKDAPPPPRFASSAPHPAPPTSAPVAAAPPPNASLSGMDPKRPASDRRGRLRRFSGDVTSESPENFFLSLLSSAEGFPLGLLGEERSSSGAQFSWPGGEAAVVASAPARI